MKLAHRVNHFSIPWHTVDGGGGTSSGDTIALAGTIGQADAGVLVGGDLTLCGGYWQPGLAKPPQPPAPPPEPGLSVYLPRIIE